MAWEDVVGRSVDAQSQAEEHLIDLAVCDRIAQIREGRPLGDGRQASGETPHLVDIVVFFDVPPGTSDGDRVQDLKKVEVQHPHQLVGGALLYVPFTPNIEGLLGIAEDLFHAAVGVQLFFPDLTVALIGQCQLVAQIIKTIVHRRGGEHQDAGAGAGADDLFHQVVVAVKLSILWIAAAAVSEVMGLVNDHKIVNTPAHFGEIGFAGKSLLPGEVGVVEYIVPQAII